MRRLMLMSAGVLYGCLGPVSEDLEKAPSAVNESTDDGGAANRASDHVRQYACGTTEPGDPEQLVQNGLSARRACDLEAMNRPSTASALPLRGVDAPSDELKAVAQLMVGRWHGTQTTPWDGTHDALLTFFENGRYSGTASDTLLFYNGEACAYHRASWSVEYGSRRLAFGQLQSVSELADTCTTDELRRIQVDEKSLRFEVWRFNEYGPITFDLQRTPVTP